MLITFYIKLIFINTLLLSDFNYLFFISMVDGNDLKATNNLLKKG